MMLVVEYVQHQVKPSNPTVELVHCMQQSVIVGGKVGLFFLLAKSIKREKYLVGWSGVGTAGVGEEEKTRVEGGETMRWEWGENGEWDCCCCCWGKLKSMWCCWW